MVSAWTTGGFFSVTSPFGLLMTSPAEASSEARRGRTRKVTSRPACSSLPPKYPPMAPAPTTKTRIPELPLFTKSVATNELAREKPATIALASPFFAERPNFKLKSPGAARLLVELPVGGRDRGGRHQQIRVVERFIAPHLSAALPHPFGIDAGIDDQMRHMDVLGAQLAGHRLGHRAKTKLRAGERRITTAAAQGSRRAGEENVAFAARQHQPRRFAPGDEACPARHFPHLAKHSVGGLNDREVDISADIENAHLKRGELVRFIKESHDFLFLARIERSGEDCSARGLNLFDQRLELFAIASPGENGESLTREFLGDFGADVVAGADHRDSGVTLFHRGSPPDLPGPVPAPLAITA